MGKEQLFRYRIVILAFSVISLLSVFSVSFWYQNRSESQYLQVHFLDVGQGDATLIETPEGRTVLIDGGRDGAVLRHLGKHRGFFNRSIDMVVVTHYDEDHIGGLVPVFSRYNVGSVLITENTHVTPTREALFELIKKENTSVYYARAEDVFDLGSGVGMKILFPDREVPEVESNTASIILQIMYGDSEFLLTGDAPQATEEFLADVYGRNLQSDVLKVGHHGSKTSTSETFLSLVDPEYAVISAGENNRYGHPHDEVMDRLRASVQNISETADEGTVSFVSDGVSVYRNE